MDPNYPYGYSQSYGGFQHLLNSQSTQNLQLSEDLNQMPPISETETLQPVSRNLFGNSQTSNKNTEKSAKWETKEDIALMSAYCFYSRDPVNGKNQKKDSLWTKVYNMYEQNRLENPADKLGHRNENQMKGRFKRLNESEGKWVAAYDPTYRLKTTGMSPDDIEASAHSFFEAGGSKFLDLAVFKEVMCKNPKWELNSDRDKRRSRSQDDEPTGESGGSTKRSRTGEEWEYVVTSNQETPNSENTSLQRPGGRDATKKKGKGIASQSSSHLSEKYIEEIRAMRIYRENEYGVMKERVDIDKRREERELKREEQKTKKMYLAHLSDLLAKDHLSPEEEEMKHNLMEWLNGM